jgi:hypothetical protein
LIRINRNGRKAPKNRLIPNSQELVMTPLRTLALAAALAACSSTPWAATPEDPHHPASAAAQQAKPKTAVKATVDQTAKMDAQMKAMREMHEKMQNAKTPEERNALMTEHMKTMQDGMAMMNGMQGMGGGMGQREQMMEKRMDMMQTMMQMMVDRMAAPAAK